MSIKHTFIDLKLAFRFAWRKFGVPGYQIHQIRLPQYRLIYIPIPKIGCTTIKQALHRMEFGTLFDSDAPGNEPYEDIHDFYKKRPGAFTGVKGLHSRQKTLCFTVIRDPVERLVSCYRNRVVDLKDLESDREALESAGLPAEPDLNTFVLNLNRYRSVSSKIRHHTRPQFRFFAGDLSVADYIFKMEEMDRVEMFLQKFDPSINLLHRKSGGTPVTLNDLSDEAMQHAIRFYRGDYELLREYYKPPERAVKKRQ